MGKVFVNITVSLDGFVTRPNVDADRPFGDDGDRIHDWMFSNPTEIDQQIAGEMFAGTGAFVLGRRMFDLGEGPWGDDGTFGKPCFVLTHRPRTTLTKGPTTFTFVTEGIHHCLDLAGQAAGGEHVCIAGGAAVIQHYLRAKLVDELWIHVAPVLFGAGTRLFEHIGGDVIALTKLSARDTPSATHFVFRVER